MILSIELVKDKGIDSLTHGRSGPRAYRLCPWLVARVLLRPLGKVIYFTPPYVITEDEIRLLAEVATEGIERATAQ